MKRWVEVPLRELGSFEKTMVSQYAAPFVGLEDIKGGGTGCILGPKEARKVEGTSFKFSQDHLLYGRLRPYLNKVAVPDFSGHCSTEIFPFRPTARLDRKYLFYWLIKDATVDKINTTCTGARMPRANLNEVLNFSLPLAPIAEQRRIIAILDEAFEGIATATANAEKSLINARGLFDGQLASLFAARDISWTELTLKEISNDFGRGKSKHRPRNDPKLYGGPYPFIQTGDVRNTEHMITEHSQTYNEAGLAQSKLWPKGTICITIAANIAETGILDFDACFPDSVIGIVVDEEKASNNFVEYLLQHFKALIQSKGQGSAQANINLATFEKQRFPIPEIREQRVIVDKLDALSESVRTLEAIYNRKIAAFDELRQSILRAAFSGELPSFPSNALDAAAE